MSRFLNNFNDEDFIRWICENDSVDTRELNREQKQIAFVLKKLLSELNITDARLSTSEREEILSRLLVEIDNSAKTKFIFNITPVVKYAAAILVFILIGIGIYNILPQREDPYNKYFSQDTPIEPTNTTQIILADGRIIEIDSKNASIHYEKDKVIINKSDTLSLINTVEDSVGHRYTKDTSASSTNITYNNIIIPYGRTAMLTLSDGSNVYLNAGSNFKYPTIFDGQTRQVMLIGEAFFEVESDKNKPFVVNANNQVLINVIGTVFDVHAYNDETSIKTTLVQGSIKVSSLLTNEWSMVSPGEQIEMDKQGNMVIKKVNTDHYISWVNGIFLFDKESFGRVLKKIERYYNIRFAFEDSLKTEIKISGKLNLNAELEEVLEVLQTTSQTSISSIKEGYYVVK